MGGDVIKGAHTLDDRRDPLCYFFSRRGCATLASPVRKPPTLAAPPARAATAPMRAMLAPTIASKGQRIRRPLRTHVNRLYACGEIRTDNVSRTWKRLGTLT